jgi:hypothetical protein
MAAQGSRAEARAVARRRRSGEKALAGMEGVEAGQAAGNKKPGDYPGLS